MKIAFVQMVLPHYREDVIEEIEAQLGNSVRFFAGDVHFDTNLRTSPALASKVTPTRNHYLFGRRLLWQSGCTVAAIHADHAILELNPRILNVWVAATVRRLLGKPTAIWGHAWSKAGRGSSRDMIRKMLRRLPDTIITYTEHQAADLRREHPTKKVIAAPNSLYSRATPGPSTSTAEPFRFIYSGRLVPMKRVDLLIDAFSVARPSLSPDARLTIIGDGPCRRVLEEQVAHLGIGRWTDFIGHQADPSHLRPLYGEAVASVSPGPVGLALTQSLWFGVAMIVADDELHGPEVDLGLADDTVLFFPAGRVECLAERMTEAWTNRQTLVDRRERISSSCRNEYSVETMAQRFVESTGHPIMSSSLALHPTGER